MTSKQFIPILEKLANMIGHDYKDFLLKEPLGKVSDYSNRFDLFLEEINDKASSIDLSLLQQEVEREDLLTFAQSIEYPVLTTYMINDQQIPVIIQYEAEDDDYQVYSFMPGVPAAKEQLSSILPFLLEGGEGKILVATPMVITPLVSESDQSVNKITGPVSRLFSLLNAEKKDIVYIYFYALLISLFSLVLPVGVQAVIELVSGGLEIDSIGILIALVIIATIISGGLQVMQLTMVEVIQRRIFVKAAYEFTYRLPRIKPEALFGQYAPELMNRFFDVLTIQKSLPKLLIDLTASVLQILFGLILLSLYHPFFIMFGVVLVLILGIVFYLTGPKGLNASLIESKYKYKVVHWLEEMARTLYSFKLAGHSSLPFQKTDMLTSNYLHYRQKQFRILIIQFICTVGFKTIVTGGLLIMGTYLLINREITLGQLVATEIVIVLVLGAVEKLILSVETVYHSLTAVEKIGHVTDIEMERQGGITLPKQEGMDIDIKGLKYKFPDKDKMALNNIDLTVKAGERVCITGFNNSGKDTLVRILSGFKDSYSGSVRLNNIPLSNVNLTTLRDYISKNVSEDELFDGTIMDNISMGRAKVSYEDVVWALESVGLWDYVSALPKGLMTEITAAGADFSGSVASKLILARCIADHPQLLILNKTFQEIEKQERLKILSFLTAPENSWTLLAITNDPLMLMTCDRILVMKEGEIVCDGSYKELLDKPDFQSCLLNPFE
ncbi:peptidase domain-containing ABC transporter [Algivirga pacifica]|uniref:ATP-binding cassette domain-containing protein n=1 Tax=Algivirga pacifica TaxID=1162670 RepID=A0ABP9DGZ0_9BACT